MKRDALDTMGKVFALILVPFLLICGFAIIIATHGIVLATMSAMGGFGFWLAALVGLACLIGLIWFCFRWVSSQGLGLLRLH